MAAMRTIVLTVGCVRTSFTFSPRHQTSRPSFKLSRYCSTVLIILVTPFLIILIFQFSFSRDHSRREPFYSFPSPVACPVEAPLPVEDAQNIQGNVIKK